MKPPTIRPWYRCLFITGRMFSILLITTLLSCPAFAADSLVGDIIRAGGSPEQAVAQAIAAGEDPVKAAGEAARLAPANAVGIAMTVLQTAPELAYEIALVVGRHTSGEMVAALKEAIDNAAPAANPKIVSAIVDKAPGVKEGETVMVNVQVDSKTNEESVDVKVKSGTETGAINVIVSRTENPTNNTGSGQQVGEPNQFQEQLKKQQQENADFDDKDPSAS